jgi:hypothetical protein
MVTWQEWVTLAVVAVALALWTSYRARHVPKPKPVAPEEAAPVVLGLQEAPAVRAEPLMGAVLRFRGYHWVQQGEADVRGRVTFVREAAVDGRAVLVEAQVCVADLERQADGTMTLRGRA